MPQRRVTILCEECGNSFPRYVSQLRERNYCSPLCSDNARKKGRFKSREADLARRMINTSFTLDNESVRLLDEVSNEREESRSETIRYLIKNYSGENSGGTNN